MRDRRFDWLYDRQKQPVKEFVVSRFAESLAEEIAAWPPPFLEWLTEEYRRRYQAGAAERPRPCDGDRHEHRACRADARTANGR